MAPSPPKRGASTKDSPNKTARKSVSDTIRYGVDTVTIEVGKQQTFVAHNQLLLAHSEFFRAALSQEWKEGQENKVPLEEQDPEIVQIFQHFTYSGQICSQKKEDLGEPDGQGNYTIDCEWERLAWAWVFGETILSTSFKDAVVDAVLVKIADTKTTPASMHDIIYPESSSKAKIRALLIDIAVWSWTDTIFEGADSSDPSEFYFDLALALHKIKAKGRQGDAPYKRKETCIYHEHGEEGTCYKKMF